MSRKRLRVRLATEAAPCAVKGASGTHGGAQCREHHEDEVDCRVRAGRPRRRHRHGGAAQGGWRGGFFRQLDTNKDGKIERTEVQAWSEARFKKLDTAGDGALTKEQYVDAMIAQIRPRLEQRFDKLDADKDGKVTAAEFEAPALARFDRRDTGKTGELSIDDLKTHRN